MLRWLHKRQGAQSLVEFAIIVPLFMIFVFGIIDFGFGLKAYISVTQATREGARYASIGNPSGGPYTSCTAATPTTVIGKVCTTMSGVKQSDIQSITVNCGPSCASGNTVSVASSYHYHYITPIKAIITFFSGGSMPDYLTVSSSTDMRLE